MRFLLPSDLLNVRSPQRRTSGSSQEEKHAEWWKKLEGKIDGAIPNRMSARSSEIMKLFTKYTANGFV